MRAISIGVSAAARPAWTAAGRLAPNAKAEVALRKQEVTVNDLAIRAEVHPDPDILKTRFGFVTQPTSALVDEPIFVVVDAHGA